VQIGPIFMKCVHQAQIGNGKPGRYTDPFVPLLQCPPSGTPAPEQAGADKEQHNPSFCHTIPPSRKSGTASFVKHRPTHSKTAWHGSFWSLHFGRLRGCQTTFARNGRANPSSCRPTSKDCADKFDLRCPGHRFYVFAASG